MKIHRYYAAVLLLIALFLTQSIKPSDQPELPSPFKNVSDNVIHEIIDLLPIPDLASFSAVARRFHELALSSEKFVEYWKIWLQRIKNLQLSSQINALAFSPNCQLVACGTCEGSIFLWDIKNSKVSSEAIQKEDKLVRELRGHTGKVTSIAFSPDGRILASVSQDKTIRLWNVKEGSTMHVLRSYQNGIVNSVAFSPDGTLLIFGSDNGSLCKWTIQNKNNLARYKPYLSQIKKFPSNFYGGSPLVFSTIGKLFACRFDNDKVALIDTESFTIVGLALGVTVIFTPMANVL